MVVVNSISESKQAFLEKHYQNKFHNICSLKQKKRRKRRHFLVKYLKLTLLWNRWLFTGKIIVITIIIGCEFVGNKATPSLAPWGVPPSQVCWTPGLIFTPRVPIVIWGGERATLWIIANLKPQTTLRLLTI